ncbi:MAG: CapA family protein [Bacteroidales bacterium]|nr:CapA family protein [Bacteroidales bacterium]
MSCCLVALLSCCRGGGTSTDGNVADEVTADDSLVVVLTGDVLLDRGVRQQIDRHGVGWLFDGVSDLFHDADATIINLECPLTDVATPVGKKFIFRADTEWAGELKKAGVTHATLANNHTNDQGLQGVASTVKCLERQGIIPLGAGKTERERLTPIIIYKGDVRVAVFNAVMLHLENWMPDDEDAVVPNETDATTLAEAIRHYKAGHAADRVMVILHWGVEFQPYPSRSQRMQARMLLNAGTDVIIGHHPHVVQTVERIDGKTVMYSLGNFVFDQHSPDTKKALMAEVVISADTLYVKSVPVEIRNCKPVISDQVSLRCP